MIYELYDVCEVHLGLGFLQGGKKNELYVCGILDLHFITPKRLDSLTQFRRKKLMLFSHRLTFIENVFL